MSKGGLSVKKILHHSLEIYWSLLLINVSLVFLARVTDATPGLGSECHLYLRPDMCAPGEQSLNLFLFMFPIMLLVTLKRGFKYFLN